MSSTPGTPSAARPVPPPPPNTQPQNGNGGDEWVFTLHVPACAAAGVGGDVVQLRQRQQPPTRASEQGLKKNKRLVNRVGADKEPVTEATTAVVVDDDDNHPKMDTSEKSERVSLLGGESGTQEAASRSSLFFGSKARQSEQERLRWKQFGGWSLESPHWSLHSNTSTLLTITYCHAWQAIPEYTSHMQCISGSASSLTRACCLQSPCSSVTTPEIEFIQETFTGADIARIETTTSTATATGSNNTNAHSQSQSLPLTNIPGIGPCRTIKVFLRPLTVSPSPVPERLRDAWDRHVQRMQPPSSSSAGNPKNNAATVEKEEEDCSSSHADYIGPVITFAVPLDAMDPPLLWKVWLPSIPRYPIAVQTLTVLDGALQTTPTLAKPHQARPVDPPPPVGPTAETTTTDPSVPAALQPPLTKTKQPTHIYINGYQSWSFSGSLPKGQSQPGSALPDAFSRAFNLGGSPPPTASTTYTSSPATTSLGEEDLPAASSSLSTTTPPSSFSPHYQSDFFTCITSDKRSDVPLFSSERRFPYQQLDETGGPALVLGWLSQKQQFGIIQSDKCLNHFQMHCSVDGQILMENESSSSLSRNGGTRAITTDWAYAQLVHPHSYDEEPMTNFLHAVAIANHARPLQNGSLLTGWCSWYVFYEKINAVLLKDNFQKLAEMRDQLPTNVSVVDDGYMAAWGDWDSLKEEAFPDGLDAVARNISSQGMRPGLWLAPFAADKHSNVARDHPDWIIRNDGGVAANSSYCGKFFYGLDATNPDVRAHVHEAIKRAAHQWKFNVLKIDFLYAACLEGNGRYDLSISRAQAMDIALQTIRDAAGPNVFLIGCGCPIASGIGYVDAMRISADTGPTWYPAPPLPWWDNGTLPCLRSMVRNSISRAPFGHRWWHNDPDCLMLGKHTSLTDDEVASAASVVAMTCGMLLLSDDLPKVSSARVSIVSKIFPLTGVTAAVLDLHCCTKDGLPSLMRLWCTDKYDLYDSFSEDMSVEERGTFDHNAKATFLARKASFNPTAEKSSHPSERLRSCIHMTKGMGTWTVVSLSNWTDSTTVGRIPPLALRPSPMEDKSDDPFPYNTDEIDETVAPNGYHVFAFWSSKYSWLSHHKEDEKDDPDHVVCKTLRPHETELFHIKRVTADMPQYIGKCC